MQEANATAGSDREEVLRQMIAVLEEITSDWDLDFGGGIGPETWLIADLTFESIDVVQLVVAIEEKFQRRDFPFEKVLMSDGRYVDDLQVSQIVDFLCEQLNA